MQTPTRKKWLLLLALLFLAAFLVRAWHPVSRPAHWRWRAGSFWSELLVGNWEGTYQRHHPGVTVMAIGGVGVRVMQKVSYIDNPIFKPINDVLTWFAVPSATQTGKEIAAGVIALSFVMALMIVAIAALIRQLSDWRMGLASGWLLAFSPYLLSQSRALHLDALLTISMMLSAVLLFYALQSGKRWYFVFSGLMGGFALLTKSPAMFLIPFTGLTLLVTTALEVRAEWDDHAEKRLGWLAGLTLRRIVLPLLGWFALAAFVFMLWPAMWVRPIPILKDVYHFLLKHAGRAHPIARFYGGEIYTHEVIAQFYPVAYAFNLSFVTFALFFVGLAAQIFWRRKTHFPISTMHFWLLIAYIVFFTIQMSIGAKQSQRYTLPAYAGFELIAAAGLVWLVNIARKALKNGQAARLGWLPSAILISGLGLQALAVLPYMPDYGAHHNHLLGGNITAVKVLEIGDQKEGLTYFGSYVDRYLDEDSVVVGKIAMDYDSILNFYDGEIVRMDKPEAQYYLFHVNDIQRRVQGGIWTPVFRKVQNTDPALIVRYDGVPYLYLYAGRGVTPPAHIAINRGGVWLIVVAWVWTLALLAVMVWAVRQTSSEDAPA